MQTDRKYIALPSILSIAYVKWADETVTVYHHNNEIIVADDHFELLSHNDLRIVKECLYQITDSMGSIYYILRTREEVAIYNEMPNHWLLTLLSN